MRGLLFALAIIGHSVNGRPVELVHVGDPNAKNRILIVGCVHGDEQAGIAIAKRLAHIRPPANTSFWIVPDLNPDGVAAVTRGNAHGVDLNRNFPWRWRDLDVPLNSGPHPLSEPESRIAYALIRTIRPTISIWFHQQLGVVDLSGGNAAIERRYARLVGLPVRRLTRYPGSAVTWENHALPGSTAFVVELHAGTLTDAQTTRFARAIVTISH